MSSVDSCDLLCLDLEKAEQIRRNRVDREAAELAAAAAGALADPTRLVIAAALEEGGELCVCDLAWVAERSDKLVSHHLRTLKAAGLAHARREGKMVMYSLSDRGSSLLRSLLAERELAT
jgi:DNA-binding transcriptional ArsR family regulator